MQKAVARSCDLATTAAKNTNIQVTQKQEEMWKGVE
jgi:hypothetical protein